VSGRASAPVRTGKRIVFLGLSITSSWGNGHATTYRALVSALAALGHELTFLERDVPWYASSRDRRQVDGCRIELYSDLDELSRFAAEVAQADAVIVGSYVPNGAEVIDWVLETARGLRLFYDIDTPVTLGQLRRGEPTYILPSQFSKFDAYLSFTGGPVLAELEQEFGAKLALPLYCSVLPELYSPRRMTPFRDLGYLGTYSADRQPTLERLLVEPASRFPEGQFVVAGSCYPERSWPSNVERLEHVAPSEHAAFYCSLRYALNVTRADMLKSGYSPSVRLFEAAACGTPIISDRWPGIERFFEPDREILLASNADEVLAHLREFSEPERRSMAQRARARVLREHSAASRARELSHYLDELANGGTSRLRASTHEALQRRAEPISRVPDSTAMVGG
jgi:spore maturation protein CgeB